MCCWECRRSTDIKYSGGTEYSGTLFYIINRVEHRCDKTNIQEERWPKVSGKLPRNYLNKLFRKIIHAHFTFIEQHHNLNPEQIGVRPMPEQQIVYWDYNNSLINILNNIRNFMLVLSTMKMLLIAYGNPSSEIQGQLVGATGFSRAKVYNKNGKAPGHLGPVQTSNFTCAEPNN